MCSAIIKYQFNTSELENVEKLVKQTAQALKSYRRIDWKCAFLYYCKIVFLVGGP